MHSELEAAMSRLESVDEAILASLRGTEASEPEMSSVFELLQTRAGILRDVCARTTACAPVSYEIFNRLIVSHERGRQAESALLVMRDDVVERLARGQTCSAYATRVTSLLRACNTYNAHK